MSKKILYSALFVACAGVLYFISFRLVDRVFKHTVELDVTAKAFKNLNLTLLYNAKTPMFSLAGADSKPLVASQFFRPVTFRVPNVGDCRYLRLHAGGEGNVVTLERITLVIRRMSRRDTLMIWGGKDIKGMIAEASRISFSSDNPRYMHLMTTGDDAYLNLNSSIADVLDNYYKQHPFGQVKTAGTALLLAVFLTVCLFYFGAARKVSVGIPVLVQRGAVLTGGFLVIIFCVFLNSRLGIFPDMKNGENRTAAAKPELSYENFFDFPDLYSNYIRDNFAFRNYLYYANSYMKVKVFEASPIPRDIIVGKNGWFFYNEINSIEDTRRLAQVGNDELLLVANSLLQKRNWLAKKNIKFYVIIPPNKDRIYPELLPGGYYKTNVGSNRLDLYKQHMANNHGFHIVDPTDSLMAARKRRDVYYSTDTHWNLYGGFKGYEVLLKEIAKDFPQLRPASEQDFLIQEQITDQGDIVQMMALQEIFKRKEYSLIFKDTSKRLIPSSNSDLLQRFTNNKTIDGSGLKLLMFRDSYANYLIPFLNVHFKDATYVWSYEFMDKLIEEEQPDVVIFESLQRFMGAAFMLPNPEGVE